MDFINRTLYSIADWMHPYMDEISIAIIATILVLYGQELNGAIIKHIKSHHFIIRLSIYVLLCAFGYGAMTLFVADAIRAALLSIEPRLQPFVVVAAFTAIGIFAERKGHI